MHEPYQLVPFWVGLGAYELFTKQRDISSELLIKINHKTIIFTKRESNSLTSAQTNTKIKVTTKFFAFEKNRTARASLYN
jgi:hypothetical protein